MTTVAEPTTDVSDLYEIPSEMDTSTWPIHRLLIESRRRVRAIGKNSRNTQQNYQFRGVDDVVNEASPIFADLGILILPMLDKVSYRDVRTSMDKPSREVTLEVTYRFTGPLGDYLDIKVPGESMDVGDKGTPKAMSVALRIALLQALMIPTKELHPDPDSQSYERGDTASRAAERAAQQPTREQLLETVKTTSTQLREALGKGEYEWFEVVVKICQNDYGVNISTLDSPDGPIVEIDLAKLRTNQLHLLWSRLAKKLKEAQSQAAVADLAGGA